ncbi:hypothetical protein BDV95DRAFT_502971 [Massariosphaeria phaeospora]|uniref:Mitochondrial distribution and morphology protein 34 n=1 Tax=Massariosphaeria phaeospora TaxID=100035 RepID=A0A7C8I0F8_9PLEO|nr:hypothetical protein BDV95DRAFT_502971 [Massariosphaeria phaeospora]
MAFNFNWSPLGADTTNARHMLTAALNKSPKPPIIVDDIIVTDLNLGTTPPSLEILEIGDLAEDRFRGVFRMEYKGDGRMTLSTRVQANPLKTYLSTTPEFASPEPLAASAGLTIPLQITLSEIRLSGFVILVFSKQKGVTLVFRNDPLESLKVSSTFDSIPFVRDYLQKEIEGQLRVLFMEDLPAIIHRLSLRFAPECQEELETEERLDGSNDATVPIDPLSTAPQDAVDAFGHPLDQARISALSLDPTAEIHASFSEKNLLHMAALIETQRTLALFTPSLRDALYRAWAGQMDRLESGTAPPALTLSSLSRIQSTFGSVKSNTSSVASGSTGRDTQGSRPTIVSNLSSAGGLSAGANRARKPKKRVVDLRKNKDDAQSSGLSSERNTPLPSANVSDSASTIPEEREDLITPPPSPATRPLRFETPRPTLDAAARSRPSDPSAPPASLLPPPAFLSSAPKPSKPKHKTDNSKPEMRRSSTARPPLSHSRLTQQTTSPLFLRSLSSDKVATLSSVDSTSGGILEQAWMHKMAQEIAKKVQREKDRAAGATGAERAWGPADADDDDEGEEGDAPPAYVA